MTKVVALIRGVGGRTAMPMAELREAVSAAGATSVVSLQVAGNLVFEDPGSGAAEVAALVHGAVLERFGHDLAVVVRSHEQLVAALAENPFAGTHEGRFVHSVFLEAAPDAARVAALDPDRSPGDRFEVVGREIHLRYAEAVGTSKLTLAWLEKQLGVIGTARNVNTVAKLVELSA